MLDKSLVFKLFEAFSIERWNDLVRPFHPMEMDKVAEKMFLAFIIGKYEEKKGVHIDWTHVITHSVFALLEKIALSDIKAPIQYIIRTTYAEEYKGVKEWIFSQYEGLIDNADFALRFSSYLFEERQSKIEDDILFASHQIASLRELEILAPSNEAFRIEGIMREIKNDVLDFVHLDGVKSFLQKGDTYKLITEIEKLRFQVRWNKSPRIPSTSVLGHSYFVSLLILLMCYDLGLDENRLYTNFFSGLFHDLPEAVTRDIISPVKSATDALPEVVKKIEEEFVERELLPLIDESYKPEVLYYIRNEFENRVMVDGEVVIVEDYEELGTKYSDVKYRACDGKLVRFADQISAFMEAESSIRHGITSEQLEDGRRRILEKYPSTKVINGFAVDKFFAPFRAN